MAISRVDEYKILEVFNDTNVDYDQDITIHELFERQVERTPNAEAIRFEDQVLTYAQLNSRANNIAKELRKSGLKPNDIVGIMIERSIEMIIGIFGVLKAGGGYLPLSISNPEARNAYMLQESKSSILLTQSKFGDIDFFSGNVIYLDDSNYYKDNCENLRNTNISSDIVYVIFTSGSTGKPKGVVIEHRSLVNRLTWMQKKYPISDNDKLIQKTPFGFDVSVWELFWWAITGAKLHILKQGHEKFPLAIASTISEHKVTVIHFVPSMLNAFLKYLEIGSDLQSLSSLKRVFCSGEALTVKNVMLFNNLLYNTNRTNLTNLYGPTEATIDVSYFDCPTINQFDVIPIGKPIDNTKLLIIHDNKLQPIGEVGELCICGVGLAREYLNRPDITNEKFVDNPFEIDTKMYKTGDLAKWLSDGNIEYIGRIDNQVKISGLRIELEEIEKAVLEFHPGMECVVRAKSVSDTVIKIVSYIVSEKAINTNELRTFLKRKLPDYMIPNIFVQIPLMPLTTNGKIDFKSLDKCLID